MHPQKPPTLIDLAEELDKCVPRQCGTRMWLSRLVLRETLESARPSQFVVDALVLTGHAWAEPDVEFQRMLQQRGLMLVEPPDPHHDPMVVRCALC